jgi:hypothetical protein
MCWTICMKARGYNSCNQLKHILLECWLSAQKSREEITLLCKAEREKPVFTSAKPFRNISREHTTLASSMVPNWLCLCCVQLSLRLPRKTEQDALLMGCSVGPVGKNVPSLHWVQLQLLLFLLVLVLHLLLEGGQLPWPKCARRFRLPAVQSDPPQIQCLTGGSTYTTSSTDILEPKKTWRIAKKQGKRRNLVFSTWFNIFIEVVLWLEEGKLSFWNRMKTLGDLKPEGCVRFKGTSGLARAGYELCWLPYHVCWPQVPWP